MEIFSDEHWTYCVLKLGRMRWGWYHGVGNHRIWWARPIRRA